MASTVKKAIKIASVILICCLILLLSLAYIHYRDLKKTLAITLSEKASAFVGQKVEIEDLSISPTSGINLYNIRIKNPKGFAPGDLLTINKVFLKLKYNRLAWGRFYFDEIAVHAPALTLQRDDRGNMNISAKLQDFFKRKSALKYQVNKFSIKSGSLDFNQNTYFRSENINISLKDFSSEPGHKTIFKGDVVYAGGSNIAVDGWGYLKDEPKKMHVNVSSGDLALSPLQDILARYGIDTKQTKAVFALNVDGDTGKGVQIQSTGEIREAGFSFFKKEIKSVRLDMDAFLNIPDNTLSFKNISMHAGGITAATLKGELKKTADDLSYTASLNLRRLDLSAINFLKGIQVGGVMRSENMHIRGSIKEAFSEVTGVVQLNDGSFISESTKITGISTKIIFLPGGKMAIHGETTASIVQAYGYRFDRPAGVDVLLDIQGKPQDMTLHSSVSLSSADLHTKEGKAVSFDSVHLNIDGSFREKIADLKSRMEIKGIQYHESHLPWLIIHSAIVYRGNSITLGNPVIEAGDFRITADPMTVTRTGGKVTVTGKRLNAAYPAKKTEIRNGAFSLQLNTGGKKLSGNLSFSIGGAVFSGVPSSRIAGSGQFNDKAFSFTIPGAEIAQGILKCSLRGKMSDGPFPLTILLNTTNMDISSLSKEAFRLAGISYSLTGTLKSAVFEGAVLSPEAVEGKAEVQAEKISLIRQDNRKIIRDASLRTSADFRREDSLFTLHAGAGKLLVSISGKANKFMKNDRLVEMQLHLAELQTTDIRETFWDIFPDNLLYAGLGGSVASDLSLYYKEKAFKADGNFTLKDIMLEGENSEFSIGPVNGIVPIVYRKTLESPSSPRERAGKDREEYQDEIKLQSHNSAEFENLRGIYSREFSGEGYSELTVGTFSYGFQFLKDIHVWIKQEGGVLNVGRFNGNIFGGRLNGSAVVSLADGLHYKAGFHLEKLSLTKLCESIEPIKGYISGKVDGVATLKGSGTGISGLIGKADFWSSSADDEKTKISKEFLKKIGGPSIKAYLGDRDFDKGIMTLYLQKGDVIFEELEISNKNLIGIQDLSVKVAPFNNRVSIDHLMWSIVEASQRAKKKE
ncbi:MAG: AsmA family protein [Thermodesulfovibrionales bacterium]|nr:AsmA family protein [Thermodesulfovibrionales bacterium]